MRKKNKSTKKEELSLFQKLSLLLTVINIIVYIYFNI